MTGSPAGCQLSASVVVTSYAMERLDGLRRCLDGILVNRHHPDEVIVVVDNNPSLESVVRLEYEMQGVTVTPSRGMGASEARNTGVDLASGDVVVFIDDDVRPTPAWLAAMVSPFGEQMDVVAVGGRILPEYEIPGRELPAEVLWLVGCTYAGHPDGPGPVTRPIGSTMAFRREALLAVGGFSRAFGPQGSKRSNSNEELAICEQLRRLYGPTCIWYQPAAEVHHWVPEDRLNWRYIARRSMVEGQSKAEVRRLYGPSSLGHDSSYVRTALLPGVQRRMLKGPRADAVVLVGVAGVTAGAYALRRLRHLAKGSGGRRRPTHDGKLWLDRGYARPALSTRRR